MKDQKIAILMSTVLLGLAICSGDPMGQQVSGTSTIRSSVVVSIIKAQGAAPIQQDRAQMPQGLGQAVQGAQKLFSGTQQLASALGDTSVGGSGFASEARVAGLTIAEGAVRGAALTAEQLIAHNQGQQSGSTPQYTKPAASLSDMQAGALPMAQPSSDDDKAQPGCCGTTSRGGRSPGRRSRG